jgi:hypothetical protein
VSLRTYPFDAIWNSDEMRNVRRDMVAGRRVSGCAECYQEEGWPSSVARGARSSIRSCSATACCSRTIWTCRADSAWPTPTES